MQRSSRKKGSSRRRRQRRRRITFLVVLGLATIGIAAVFALRTPTEIVMPSGDLSQAELVALGKSAYKQHCASCHGGKLEGQPNWKRPLPTGGYPAPPHNQTGHTWHHPDQLLFKITKYGGQASAGKGFQSNMPACKEVLSDTEIWAVLTYIKSRWPLDVQAKQAQRTRRQH
jgi:mono/diheme cytochrome c family protein